MIAEGRLHLPPAAGCQGNTAYTRTGGLSWCICRRSIQAGRLQMLREGDIG